MRILFKTPQHSCTLCTLIKDHHLAQLAGMALGVMDVAGVQGRGTPSFDCAVYIDTVSMAECMESDELELCVRKPFSSKKFRSLKPVSLTFVLATLCSGRYEVNHTAFKHIDRDFMLYVWEFLQTTRVSSSERLSCLLERLLGSRSKQGFEASFPQPPGREVYFGCIGVGLLSLQLAGSGLGRGCSKRADDHVC